MLRLPFADSSAYGMGRQKAALPRREAKPMKDDLAAARVIQAYDLKGNCSWCQGTGKQSRSVSPIGLIVTKNPCWACGQTGKVSLPPENLLWVNKHGLPCGPLWACFVEHLDELAPDVRKEAMGGVFKDNAGVVMTRALATLVPDV